MMKQTVENYIPQISPNSEFARRGFWVWSLVGLFVFVWVSLIFAAPLAKLNGFNSLADSIYYFFSYLCHQISERSFHVYEHKLGVCTRCFGIYAGILLGVLLYPLLHRFENVEPPSRLWLFLSPLPMTIDFSGQTFFGWWQNTHLSRGLTGAIFGVIIVFFIMPGLVEITGYFRSKPNPAIEPLINTPKQSAVSDYSQTHRRI